jgi:hypothetical protein
MEEYDKLLEASTLSKLAALSLLNAAIRDASYNGDLAI